MNRHYKYVALALLLISGLVLLVTRPQTETSITNATFRQLRPGTTEAEISAVLGLQPTLDRSHRTRAVELDQADWFPVGVDERIEDGSEKAWVTDKSVVYVSFTPEGRAHYFTYLVFSPRRSSLLDWLRTFTEDPPTGGCP